MRKIFKYILCACLTSVLFFAGEGTMWAGSTYNVAKLKVAATGNGTVYVESEGKTESEKKNENSELLSFSIVAQANSGYHFLSWEVKPWFNNKAGKGSVNSFGNVSNTTVTLKPGDNSTYDEFIEDSPDEYYKNHYLATASFAANYYTQVTTAVSSSVAGGTAYVKYGTPFSGTATIADDGNGQIAAGVDDTYSIYASSTTGYVFDHWEVTNGTLSSSTNASTTVTVKTNASYQGSTNKYPCTVTAYFKEYKAKLNTSVSSSLSGTSAGTAQVQANDSSWGSSATKTINASNADVAFSVKATAKKGYQFKGWATSNGSTSYISGLGATGTYNVKSSSTVGGTNEKSIYAVFDKGNYTVHFDKNAPSGCTVEGTMSDQTFTSMVAKALSANNYVCDFVITYDSQGGSVCTETRADRFSNWKVDGESTTYTDKQSITRTETHGTTLTLKAVWASSKQVTLSAAPTKMKGGVPQTFLGWYDAASGGSKVGDAGQTVTITASKTLYARWKTYNITVKTNLVSGTSTGKVIVTVQRTGSSTDVYKLSIPVGNSVTLKDVPNGEYTVTPDASWTWDSTITPASSTQSFTDSTDELIFNFNVTPKTGTKKHDEASSQASY